MENNKPTQQVDPSTMKELDLDDDQPPPNYHAQPTNSKPDKDKKEKSFFSKTFSCCDGIMSIIDPIFKCINLFK